VAVHSTRTDQLAMLATLPRYPRTRDRTQLPNPSRVLDSSRSPVQTSYTVPPQVPLTWRSSHEIPRSAVVSLINPTMMSEEDRTSLDWEPADTKLISVTNHDV
jgi:hypothetical protein